MNELRWSGVSRVRVPRDPVADMVSPHPRERPLCQPGPVLATWAEMTLDTITGTRKTSFGARPAAAVEAPGAHT